MNFSGIGGAAAGRPAAAVDRRRTVRRPRRLLRRWRRGGGGFGWNRNGFRSLDSASGLRLLQCPRAERPGRAGCTFSAVFLAAGRRPRIRRRRATGRPTSPATSTASTASTTARPSAMSSHGRGRPDGGVVDASVAIGPRPIVSRDLDGDVQAVGSLSPCDSSTFSSTRNSGAVSSSWMKRRMSRYSPDSAARS